MNETKENRKVHTLSENGEQFYSIVDHNGNFVAKTYSMPEAVRIAAIPETIQAVSDLRHVLNKNLESASANLYAFGVVRKALNDRVPGPDWDNIIQAIQDEYNRAQEVLALTKAQGA